VRSWQVIDTLQLSVPLTHCRFGGNIASEGYIVALPCVFHEFEGPEPISYDTQGTDKGNSYKVGG
jgi:dienelactone hydrolase